MKNRFFSLEEIVFNTVHKNSRNVSVQEIAANTGVGYNHLTRMANMNDDCNMPLRLAVPLMNSTEDYSLLSYMAKQTGHLCIKMPRGIRKGTDPKMDVSTYAKEFHELVPKLMEFINEPSDAKMEELDNLMRKHIGDSENIRRRCRKHNLHQRELSL